ncbi:MAG: hypothetical protein WC655_00670 [Candidatus Hydrogenedentales bacterium]|jgi:hypothetical protein
MVPAVTYRALGAAHEAVATIPFNEPVYATPAFLDGRMYVRTAENLYCIAANGNG